MFIVFLKFSDNKTAAPEHMPAHNDWIAQGFADGVFQCVGSITPASGGMILALEDDLETLQARINQDPFVIHNVVRAEITQIDIKKTTPALNHLKGAA